MKNVLITGGSRGIGAECVHAFTDKGYKVAFTYNCSVDRAEEISQLTGAFAIKCAMESEHEIISAVEQANRYFGESGVDVLVNNAAISEIKLFSDITSEAWQRMMTVNLTAPYIFCREVLHSMIHKKLGRIINVSSMWGQVGASCEVHYSTAKAGLIGMTKALAKELGPSGITVNAVAPGVISTEMNAHLTKGEAEMLAEEIPLSRFGTVSEVASTVLFLADEGSSYVTGQVIGVNGGMVV